MSAGIEHMLVHLTDRCGLLLASVARDRSKLADVPGTSRLHLRYDGAASTESINFLDARSLEKARP